MSTRAGMGGTSAAGRRCENTRLVADLDGGKMPDVLEFTFGQAISYPGKPMLSGQAYYSSSYPVEFSGRFRQNACWNLNACAEFSPASTGLSFFILGQNFTDQATVWSTISREPTGSARSTVSDTMEHLDRFPVNGAGRVAFGEECRP